MAKIRFPSPPKRVQIQQLRGSDTGGSRGGSPKTWTVIETVYLSIDTASGSETAIGQQIDAKTTHMMQGHYTSTLTPQSRIIHGDNTYEIVFVDNVEQRDRWAILQCMRIVA